MPRQARNIPSIGYMHVISRGNNKRRVFRYDRNKKQYYTYLKGCKYEDAIEICHYCLMSNHVHLLVGLNEESDLSRFMKRVNLKYVYYHRKRYSYCGHLWQDRFQGKIIEKENYFIRCGKYIELNPVRAGMVSSPEQYQFSSYHYYAFGRKDPLITENPLYKEFGKNSKERQQVYRNLMAEE